MPTSQEILRSLWREFLAVDEAEPGADFFDLGGDSLLALELMAAFEEATQIQFPLEVLFVEGTLASLEDAIA